MKKSIKVASTAPKKHKVHPLADLFPMLNDDDLQGLADDISANGLLQPIRRDAKNQIVDGRNRLAACEIAGVEPQFELFDGDEDAIRSFILSSNIHRRHMNKGQRAMAVALMYPEAERGRGKKDEAWEKSHSVGLLGQESLRKARAVIRVLEPAKADAVLAGALQLNEAYEEAKEKGQGSSAERRLHDLRKRAPEIADQVENEELTLDEAEERATEEAETQRKHRLAVTTNLVTALNNLNDDPQHAAEIREDFDESIAEQIFLGKSLGMVTRIERAIDLLGALKEEWTNQPSRTKTKRRAKQVE